MCNTGKTNKVFFIFGPTASGKTSFAERLALHIPAEIVNMDSMQMYTPLTIGTAKSDWQATSFKQHLFDIINEPRTLTVHAYRALAEQKIKEIQARNRIPIFVGGSGFYLKALLFAVTQASIQLSDTSDAYMISAQDLWQRLHEIDPERAAHIHPHDEYRLRRALEIWYTTGQKPSLYKPQYAPIAPWTLIKITCDRKKLYERIDERVCSMLQGGWLEEVKTALAQGWRSFITEKGIGYAELIDHLQGTLTLEQATHNIQQKTRNYAKRQETYWRTLLKDLDVAQSATDKDFGSRIEFDLTDPAIDLYIKQLVDDMLTLKTGDV